MRKIALAAFALLGLGAAPAPAHAWTSHGGGGSGGHGWGHGSHVVVVPRVFIGGGPFWYGYPPYPYGYYAYPVVVQQTPQVYVQPAPGAQQQYWYYCRDPAGYYPSVGQCPSGWVRVVPNDTPGDL